MVVFTCGHCGESVQKPKVEKHYLTKCRNRSPNLSCMDCFKDFLGNDYESHTKCITEEERYSGKGFVVKEKKGEKKQNTWVEMVQSVLDEQKTASGSVLRIIKTVSKHNNTPRKKPKFINFVKNVCGPKTNPKDIDQAWDLISVKLSALSNANNQSRNETKPEINEKSEENDEDSIDVKGDEKDDNDKEKLDTSVEGQNGEDEATNHVTSEEANDKGVTNKKLSKKQRKEEKKRKKYEAELQSAVVPPPVEEEETQSAPTKKGKKKKNKSECSTNGEAEDTQSEEKNKNKKRKRQDTVHSVSETHENDSENIENIPVTAATKVSKKKQRVEETDEQDESICLHDQNVAKIGELTVNSDSFNWHATIMSVLNKKGDEMPFKRLQKKVLMAYSEATGQDVDDRIADKFIKKLRSAPNVRVVKNTVFLME